MGKGFMRCSCCWLKKKEVERAADPDPVVVGRRRWVDQDPAVVARSRSDTPVWE